MVLICYASIKKSIIFSHLQKNVYNFQQRGPIKSFPTKRFVSSLTAVDFGLVQKSCLRKRTPHHRDLSQNEKEQSKED